jgi:hypothetical protein
MMKFVCVRTKPEGSDIECRGCVILCSPGALPDICPFVTDRVPEWKEVRDDSYDTRCWYCGGEMIWGSDFNYDEVFGEGEGIVSYLTCTECGATAEFSIRDDDPDETPDNSSGKDVGPGDDGE